MCNKYTQIYSEIYTNIQRPRVSKILARGRQGQPGCVFASRLLVAEMGGRDVETARSILYHVKEHPSDASEPPKITTRASQGPQI